jgi:hypothetical protein
MEARNVVVEPFTPAGAVALLRTLRRRVEPRAFAAALGIALFLVTKVAWFASEGPVLSGDGHIWAKLGERSLLGAGFWRSTRPFTLPLVNRILGFSDERVIWFQCLLGAVAWSVWALTLTRIFSTLPGKCFVLVGTLALALSSSIHGWDAVIRSESVSLSFLVLMFAAIVNHVLRPAAQATGWRAWIWAIVTVPLAVLAAFSRDTNGFLLALAAVALVAVSLIRERRERRVVGVVLACVLLTVAIAASSNAHAGKRYRFPLMNVVFQRILPEKEKLDYFSGELGMPVSPALMTRTRKWVSSDDWFARRSPALAEFRAWVVRDGYPGYQRYLLTHLPATVEEAYAHFPRFTAARFHRLPRRPSLDGSKRLNALLSPSAVVDHPYLWSLAVLSTAGASLIVARGRFFAGWLVALLLSAAWVAAYVAFHGDAMEVDRHGMLVGILFRLAVITTVTLWIDTASRLLRSTTSYSASRARSPKTS